MAKNDSGRPRRELRAAAAGKSEDKPDEGEAKQPIDFITALTEALGTGKQTPITGDEVKFHTDPARKDFIVPLGTSFEFALQTFAQLQADAEKITRTSRVFRYLSDDGAYAASKVIRDMFGMSLGEVIKTMFGDQPPRMRTVQLSLTESVEVPWGKVSIPSLPKAELYIADAYDEDYGRVFNLFADAKKKDIPTVIELFDRVEAYLKDHSIYRGKAIVGAESPKFMDLSTFDPAQIVFSDQVYATLEDTLWSVIRYSQAMSDDDIRLKRSLLLWGPFGTGKSSAGLITAQICEDNGWTFILARPGKDDPNDILRLARLYEPAVVQLEDIDGFASSADDDDVAQMLETFDGATSKGARICLLATTNHIDRVHQGMLRPGRFDAIEKVDVLDHDGVVRLVQAVVSSDKLGVVDFDKVGEAMEGFYPAFVRETLERAKMREVSRRKGGTDYVLGTDELVAAAVSLRPQLEQMEAASQGEKPEPVDQSLFRVVRRALNGTHMEYESDVDVHVMRPQ